MFSSLIDTLSMNPLNRPQSGTSLLWETLPEPIAPDVFAPTIIWAYELLYHDMVGIQAAEVSSLCKVPFISQR